MEYDAVVFDNDGVLTRLTELTVLRDAIREALTDHGVEDPPEAHVRRLYDVSVDDVRAVADAHGIDAESLWRTRDERAAAAQIQLLRDGGKPLYDDVDAIEGISVPKAVVSNNQQATVDAIVEHYGLDAFDPVYGRNPTLEDVGRKKPDTHYIDRVLDDLGTRTALYVGDSGKDVVAAHRAGIDAAFVRRPHREDLELPEVPEYEADDLEELVSELGY